MIKKNNKQYPQYPNKINNHQIINKILLQFPVGCIGAFIGGYYSDGANGGFFNVLGNTINDVNLYLSSVDLTGTTLFKVCDGSGLNDPNSPIYNGAHRYLPNLTNSIFLMGSREFGKTVDILGRSGSNNLSDHQHIFSLYGLLDTANINTSHSHRIYIYSSTHSHRHNFNIQAEPGTDFSCIPPDGSSITQANDLYLRDWGSGNKSHTVNTTLGAITTGNTSVSLNHTHNSFTFGASVNGSDPLPSSINNIPNYLSCFYVQRVR